MVRISNASSKRRSGLSHGIRILMCSRPMNRMASTIVDESDSERLRACRVDERSMANTIACCLDRQNREVQSIVTIVISKANSQYRCTRLAGVPELSTNQYFKLLAQLPVVAGMAQCPPPCPCVLVEQEACRNAGELRFIRGSSLNLSHSLLPGL